MYLFVFNHRTSQKVNIKTNFRNKNQDYYNYFLYNLLIKIYILQCWASCMLGRSSTTKFFFFWYLFILVLGTESKGSLSLSHIPILFYFSFWYRPLLLLRVSLVIGAVLKFSTLSLSLPSCTIVPSTKCIFKEIFEEKIFIFYIFLYLRKLFLGHRYSTWQFPK